MSECPVDWLPTTVGSLCDLLNGLAFKPEDWTRQGLPIIRIQNLNGSQDFNRYDKPVPEPYFIRAGTILFSWSGNRGTSFGPYRWSGPTGILNQHIFKATPTEDAEPGWLFHALHIARERAERSAHGGSGLVHVRRGDLRSYAIFRPPLPEQRQIAAILDTVDEAIRKTEQIIAKLKQVKQGLLHDLLTRGIDENGELRDPERHPEQFKESVSGRIPRGWEAGILDDWISTPPKNGYSPKEVDDWTGTFMLGLGCLTTDGFEPRQLKNAPHGDARVTKALLKEGDLLLTRSNTRELVGLAGVYSDIGAPCMYPDLMMRIGPSARSSAGFLELVLRSGVVRRQMQAAACGTSGSMVKLSGSIVRRLRVAMPAPAEQSAILAAISESSARLRNERIATAKLRRLRQALMEDLLTGRVRVTPLLEGAGT
jgi:type I restriction enzyme S subunit